MPQVIIYLTKELNDKLKIIAEKKKCSRIDILQNIIEKGVNNEN